VIKCQETRSREENRRIARRLLVGKLDVLENGDESLQGIRKWREVRKKNNREKKSRRKYRRLEEEKKIEGKVSDDAGECGNGEVTP
jgi:peptide chain release factor